MTRHVGDDHAPEPDAEPASAVRPAKRSGVTLAPKTVGILAAVVAGGVLLSMAGDEVDDVAYCVDDADTVVDSAACDDTASGAGGHAGGGGSHWFLVGRYADNQPVGTRLDPSLATNRVASTDATGRAVAGLTSTGPQSTGKSISGKTGGFGRGLFGGKGFGG